MAVLTWDGTGEKYFETGVSKGVLYPISSSGTYDTGVAWNGLTSVSETPSGAEPTDLWADNIKYGTLRSPETYGGTIEAYTYPDEFAECDGSALHASATGVKLGQQSRKVFGFSYRTQIGDDTDPAAENAYLLHLVYGATASPSERTYNTINDSPEAITFSWEFTCTGVETAGYKPVSSITIDSPNRRRNLPRCVGREAVWRRFYGSGTSASCRSYHSDDARRLRDIYQEAVSKRGSLYFFNRGKELYFS